MVSQTVSQSKPSIKGLEKTNIFQKNRKTSRSFYWCGSRSFSLPNFLNKTRKIIEICAQKPIKPGFSSFALLHKVCNNLNRGSNRCSKERFKLTQLLKYEDVQQRLQLSRSTVLRLIEKGLLERIYVFGAPRITDKALETFINNQVKQNRRGNVGL